MKKVLMVFVSMMLVGAAFGAPGSSWNLYYNWDDSANPFVLDPFGATGLLAWSIHDADPNRTLSTFGGTAAGAGWGNGGGTLGLTDNAVSAGCGLIDDTTGHGPWVVRWTAPNSNGNGSGYWIKVEISNFGQWFEPTRRVGINVQKNGVFTGLVVMAPLVPGDPNFNTLPICVGGSFEDCTNAATARVNMVGYLQVTPGDKIDFAQGGIGWPFGDGVATFSSQNIIITHEASAPTQFSLTVNVVKPGVINPTTVIPPIGTTTLPAGIRALQASEFTQCPTRLGFSKWQGTTGDNDPNYAITTVDLNSNKTVTVTFVDIRACGDVCHKSGSFNNAANNFQADMNADCVVNLSDFAVVASNWLVDNRPLP